MTKKEILGMPSVGYWSALNGVEVKEIEYGIEDYCLCVSGCWNGKKVPHRLKIYYEDDPYIKLDGIKLKFNECLRMDI